VDCGSGHRKLVNSFSASRACQIACGHNGRVLDEIFRKRFWPVAGHDNVPDSCRRLCAVEEEAKRVVSAEIQRSLIDQLAIEQQCDLAVRTSQRDFIPVAVGSKNSADR
jgi:hypothetical protein